MPQQHSLQDRMMTSSYENIFCVTCPLGQWRGALMFSLICAWINGWVNNREAAYLRRHRAHHDVAAIKPISCRCDVCVLQASQAELSGCCQTAKVVGYLWLLSEVRISINRTNTIDTNHVSCHVWAQNYRCWLLQVNWIRMGSDF